MVYDVFEFFNESELLEIRLNELSNVVDQFIICESTYTHSGVPKPLNFRLDRYPEFKGRIVYLVDRNPPNNGDSWANENHQRAHIKTALDGVIGPGDYIIVSDLDEIPSGQATKEALTKLGDNIIIFKHRTYYYYVNYFALEYVGSKVLTFEYFSRRFEENPQKVRDYWAGPDILILNGGWHFGYLGGKERVEYKLNSFAHQEHKQKGEIPQILSNINEMIDLRGRSLTRVTVDNTYPTYLLKNLDKFQHFIGV